MARTRGKKGGSLPAKEEPAEEERHINWIPILFCLVVIFSIYSYNTNPAAKEFMNKCGISVHAATVSEHE